jgi:hypothetical protein
MSSWLALMASGIIASNCTSNAHSTWIVSSCRSNASRERSASSARRTCPRMLRRSSSPVRNAPSAARCWLMSMNMHPTPMIESSAADSG